MHQHVLKDQFSYYCGKQLFWIGICFNNALICLQICVFNLTTFSYPYFRVL